MKSQLGPASRHSFEMGNPSNHPRARRFLATAMHGYKYNLTAEYKYLSTIAAAGYGRASSYSKVPTYPALLVSPPAGWRVSPKRVMAIARDSEALL